MTRQWTGIAAGAVLLACLVVGASWVYVTAYGNGAATAERPAAMKAARQTQRQTHGHLWVAAYVPNAGTPQQSNTGHSCFGRTVQVHMVWRNAGFDSGGDTPSTPKALVVTADATSGTICFVQAVYGPAATDLPSNAIYLYGPRQELLPSAP